MCACASFSNLFISAISDVLHVNIISYRIIFFDSSDEVLLNKGNFHLFRSHAFFSVKSSKFCSRFYFLYSGLTYDFF